MDGSRLLQSRGKFDLGSYLHTSILQLQSGPGFVNRGFSNYAEKYSNEVGFGGIQFSFLCFL